MNALTNFAKIVGTILMIAVCGVFVFFIWAWVIAALLGFIGLFLFVWAIGTRLKITKTVNGQKITIGHLRWFTITKY